MGQRVVDPNHPPSGKRVAFFGGSFDPPHLGHLAVARAAREALGLDAVLFAPVGAQPLKPLGSTASFDDRVAMTRLAIEGEPGFAVSLVDAPKPEGSPNFTLETLFGLRAQLPLDGALFCLMGADSFFALRHWHRAEEIPFVAPLIVASRPGQQHEWRLDGLKEAMPQGLSIEATAGSDETRPAVAGIEIRAFVIHNAAGQESPFYLLPGLDVEISASRVRDLIREHAPEASGDPAAGQQLLRQDVFEYIRSHGLYR